jgi:hypothetical protein
MLTTSDSGHLRRLRGVHVRRLCRSTINGYHRIMLQQVLVYGCRVPRVRSALIEC